MRNIFSNTFFLFLLIHSTLWAQTEKIPDIAVASFVKTGKISLRWATGKQELWKAGNQYGYKIERILFDDFKSVTDPNTRAVIVNQEALKPWPQNDERWNWLIKKNKNAGLLFNLLYKPGTNASTENKEIVYAMVLKSCDLYADIAKAAGLFVSDSTFNENEIYIYRISLWDAPNTIKYSPGLITVNAKEKSALSKLKPIKVKFSNKKAVVTLVTANTENDYSGFWIERSPDSINYIVVNKAPLIHSTTKTDINKTESTYKDSLPQNNKIFYYRARGISYFGELSEPSNMVSGKGKADFTAYPFIDSTTIIGNKIISIKFHMPQKFDNNELRGYRVLRSETRKGNYTSITSALLSNQAKEFKDEKPLQDNYYKICAININNDSSFSFTTHAKLIDETPPIVPTGVTGKIDTSGSVTLSWNENKETDLLGYRVFRCNDEREQPVEITKTILTEAKFTDKVSLQTLTKEVYYTVRSVDKVGNNSTYSSLCKLNRPDKIAPVGPLFKQVIFNDSSIEINWQLSTSNDVVVYQLLRSEKNGADWQTLKEWSGTDSMKKYTDAAISIGKRYSYRLEVSDEAKNTSFVNSPSVLFQPAFAPKIKTLTAKANLEKRNIALSWTNNLQDIYSYTLYKAKGDEPLRIFKTLEARTDVFTDAELYPNNIYRYAIKATLKSGSETTMSSVLKVEF